MLVQSQNVGRRTSVGWAVGRKKEENHKGKKACLHIKKAAASWPFKVAIVIVVTKSCSDSDCGKMEKSENSLKLGKKNKYVENMRPFCDLFSNEMA